MSLIAAFLWLIIANLRAMFPSKDSHWRFAYLMIAIGIPILGWVTYEFGPIFGVLLLAAACSVLRWPLIYLWRWLKARVQ
ncbi:MAG: DUF2484 family protein [Pseudomonadota bacterium]